MSDFPDPQPSDLPPRAQAALVALRRGGLTVRTLSSRIADASVDETRSLLADMQRRGIVEPVGDVWYLDEAGISWLALRGLTVPREHTLAGVQVDPEITLVLEVP